MFYKFTETLLITNISSHFKKLHLRRTKEKEQVCEKYILVLQDCVFLEEWRESAAMLAGRTPS